MSLYRFCSKVRSELDTVAVDLAVFMKYKWRACERETLEVITEHDMVDHLQVVYLASPIVLSTLMAESTMRSSSPVPVETVMTPAGVVIGNTLPSSAYVRTTIWSITALS